MHLKRNTTFAARFFFTNLKQLFLAISRDWNKLIFFCRSSKFAFRLNTHFYAFELPLLFLL